MFRYFNETHKEGLIILFNIVEFMAKFVKEP